MAKQKKKSGKTSFVNSLESTKEVKAKVRQFNFKKALILIVSTLAAFVLLEGVIQLEAQAGLSFSIITLVYYIAAALLVLAIIFLNRGFSKKELTPDMLDEGTPPEEAEKICALVNSQKKLAKKVMLVLVPILFAIFFDLMYLFYGDILAQFFSFFA
ncbi:MAG: hypothetical protein E7632_03355 [Ruminococcaceae bacterium]|nr:hypothetical protein [Oscillospiraceae bacterium]